MHIPFQLAAGKAAFSHGILVHTMRPLLLGLALTGIHLAAPAQQREPMPEPTQSRLDACIYDNETLQLIPAAELSLAAVGHGLETALQPDTGCIRMALPRSPRM